MGSEVQSVRHLRVHTIREIRCTKTFTPDGKDEVGLILRLSGYWVDGVDRSLLFNTRCSDTIALGWLLFLAELVAE